MLYIADHTGYLNHLCRTPDPKTPLHISDLFSTTQLTGKQVSWAGVREATAVLKRPSTVEEIAEAAWTRFSVYVARIGCRVRKLHNHLDLVENMVKNNLEGGKLLSVSVAGTEFVWLEQAEWPDQKERERMENYRTVHQAVRGVMEDIVSSGEKYSGVFAQVKRIHQFVERHTRYTKKHVR